MTLFFNGIKDMKKIVRKVIRAVYGFYIVRKEKAKATVMFRKGVRAAREMARRLNGPRVYLWFDQNTMQFVPMVYEPRPKNDAPAMRTLQRYNRIKAHSHIQVDDMKRKAFFFTASRWGAKGITDDGQLREKYRYWLSFYMTYLSVPIQKWRSFRP